MKTWKFWEKARILSDKVYPLTFKEPISSDFRMKDQLRGSSGSIMDNNTEGFERGSKFEFINSLTISKGETGELKSQFYRCLDNKYITQKLFDELYNLADELTEMITSFMNYLNNSKIKGQKFKNRTTNG
ncbi:MAG TPA: four helix bundle protein [Chitinophagaceae bacterium]|nr:four helix bundle protein [Chitinophagaceae bacterium]